LRKRGERADSGHDPTGVGLVVQSLTERNSEDERGDERKRERQTTRDEATPPSPLEHRLLEHRHGS
jgi:hypothetical protein